jgi:hypothetical protein
MTFAQRTVCEDAADEGFHPPPASATEAELAERALWRMHGVRVEEAAIPRLLELVSAPPPKDYDAASSQYTAIWGLAKLEAPGYLSLDQGSNAMSKSTSNCCQETYVFH